MDNQRIYEKANCYFDKEEYQKAFHLFLDLAKEDDVDGQNMLSYMYSNGYGIKQNKAKEKFWLEKSSRIGSYYADHKLACLYLEDNQIGKGLKLLNEVANKEYAESIYLLAGYYYYGKHVEENKDKAIALYEKAIMLDHEDAARDLVGAWRIKYVTRRKTFMPIMKMLFRFMKFRMKKFFNR